MQKVLILLSFGFVAACGASAADEAGASGPGAFPGAGQGAEGEEPDPFVPEEEIEAKLQVPQSGAQFVFVVSTGLDAVVRIDAVTAKVDLIEVGAEPQAMRTLPGEDSLVVINLGTRDYSVVRAAAEPTVTTLDAPTPTNRLEISPNGAWAVAWYDPAEEGPLGDLQQVHILGLTEGAETVNPVGVGFHPVGVTFAPNDDRVFVITEDGVSIIDMAQLSGPSFQPAVPVTPDPFEDPLDREVLVTPDGARAVVRRGGVAELRIVDLATADAVVVTLDGPPTDVDLSPDASEALVTIRDTAQLVRVPLDDVEAAVTLDLSGTPAGLLHLTADGARAVLYSTLPDNEWVAVLSLADNTVWTYPLQKDIKTVAAAPDGQSVIVLHKKDDGEPTPGDLEDQVDKSWGYSVVLVESGFSKLELTEHEPLSIALTPDGDNGYVLLPHPGAHSVDVLDLRTAHQVRVPLGSPPEHAVYVPAASRVAVSQDHPVGRITFIAVDGGQTETVTGFELNGLIE